MSDESHLAPHSGLLIMLIVDLVQECDRVEAQLNALQASHPQELEALQHQLTALRQQQVWGSNTCPTGRV